MDNHFFFNDERYFFLNYKWYLNLDWFHLCLVYEHLLILDTISIGFNWHLFYYLYRNPSLNFSLYALLFSYYPLHNFLNLYCFYFLLLAYYWSIDVDLYWYFNFLNYYLGHWNLNNLQNCLINYDYFLYNFRHFDYFFDDSWHHDNLFNNFLYLNHSGNFNNFLNDSINKLLLNFQNFFLDNYRNWYLHMNWFDYFLFGRHNFDFLNLNFFDFFRHVGNIHLVDDWNLLSNVQRNYFFNLNVFCHKNLLNNGLVYKYFYFSYYFFFVPFYEMRAFNKYFFGDFFDNLLLHL